MVLTLHMVGKPVNTTEISKIIHIKYLTMETQHYRF